jgi:Flp pilus assembly pilin Flp
LIVEENGIASQLFAKVTMAKRSFLARLMRDQSGATALEYCLIIGCLSIVIIVAAQGLGMGTGSVWTGAKAKMDAATP